MGKAILVNQTAVARRYVESENADAKGRKNGVFIETYEGDMIDRPEGQVGYYYSERMTLRGRVYALCLQAGKDGSQWGASQGFKFFGSEAERDAAIAKRVKKLGLKGPADQITNKE